MSKFITGELWLGGGNPGPPCIYPSSFVIKQKNTHVMLFLIFICVQPVLNDLEYMTIATTHENYSWLQHIQAWMWLHINLRSGVIAEDEWDY